MPTRSSCCDAVIRSVILDQEGRADRRQSDLANLVPLCSRHHHAVHEGQWTIKLLPDRTLRVFRPDGAHHGNAMPDRFDAVQNTNPAGRRRRSDN
jgi:hypothetical protein